MRRERKERRGERGVGGGEERGGEEGERGVGGGEERGGEEGEKGGEGGEERERREEGREKFSLVNILSSRKGNSICISAWQTFSEHKRLQEE